MAGSVLFVAVTYMLVGCGTHMELTGERLVPAERGVIAVEFESDLDLDGERAADLVRRFEFVLLDEEMLDRYRQVRDLPSDLALAGPKLLSDYESTFSAFYTEREIGTDDNGLTKLRTTEVGGYVYRVVIARRSGRKWFSGSASDEEYDCIPEGYLLRPGGSYFLWGRVVGRNLMQWSLESNVILIGLRMRFDSFFEAMGPAHRSK